LSVRRDLRHEVARVRPDVEEQERIEDRRQVQGLRAPEQRAAPLRPPVLGEMPDEGDLAMEGDLAIGVGAARERGGHARKRVRVGEGMVAWEVPARGELRRSDAWPPGQPCCPRLGRPRVEHLVAPREVRRVLAFLVEIMVMEVKVFLVPLVHPPGRASVEASMHPVGKRRFKGFSDRDQLTDREQRTNLFHPRSAQRWAKTCFDRAVCVGQRQIVEALLQRRVTHGLLSPAAVWDCASLFAARHGRKITE
jgi:hypothetical protein